MRQGQGSIYRIWAVAKSSSRLAFVGDEHLYTRFAFAITCWLPLPIYIWAVSACYTLGQWRAAARATLLAMAATPDMTQLEILLNAEEQTRLLMALCQNFDPMANAVQSAEVIGIDLELTFGRTPMNVAPRTPPWRARAKGAKASNPLPTHAREPPLPPPAAEPSSLPLPPATEDTPSLMPLIVKASSESPPTPEPSEPSEPICEDGYAVVFSDDDFDSDDMRDAFACAESPPAPAPSEAAESPPAPASSSAAESPPAPAPSEAEPTERPKHKRPRGGRDRELWSAEYGVRAAPRKFSVPGISKGKGKGKGMGKDKDKSKNKSTPIVLGPPIVLGRPPAARPLVVRPRAVTPIGAPVTKPSIVIRRPPTTVPNSRPPIVIRSSGRPHGCVRPPPRPSA